jgi:hypothetical protein
MKLSTKLGSGLLALALGCAGEGASAGEAETALLQSFMGTFSGKGVLTENGKQTNFECKMTVSKGNRGKIVFRASCPLVAGTGAMTYNEASGRFEVVFSSSTDLKGTAVGRRNGDAVAFNLADRAVDAENNTLDYKVRASMSADTISVTFDALLNKDPWAGTLDFRRSGD